MKDTKYYTNADITEQLDLTEERLLKSGNIVTRECIKEVIRTFFNVKEELTKENIERLVNLSTTEYSYKIKKIDKGQELYKIFQNELLNDTKTKKV